MYQQDLALNNLQGLICHKAQLDQTKQKIFRTHFMLRQNDAVPDRKPIQQQVEHRSID